MRIALVALACLAAGFGLGWTLRPVPPARGTAATTKEIAAASEKKTTVGPTPAAALKPLSFSVAAAPDLNSIASRTAALRWFKQKNLVPPTRLMNSDFKVNPVAIDLLELTPAEVNTLNTTFAAAQTDIVDARAKIASAGMSTDGKLFVIELPALDPATSAAIYDRFATQLKTTLGADRYALMNEMADESADTAFDGFGLNPLRYEAKAAIYQPAPGLRMLEVERHHSAVTGGYSGSVGGRFTRDELDKDPYLSRFLPETVKNQLTVVPRPAAK